MRYHRAFSDLAFVLGEFAERTTATHLVAARFEPVVRGGSSAGLLDLHFRDSQDRRSVVPFVIVDVSMLELRERDPLVWPGSVDALGDRLDSEGIGQRVEAWLRELAAAGPMSRECWHIFGTSDDEKSFLAGRTANFLGAAPVENVARKAAPFVFARRHARSRDVVIASRDAELGAVLLAPIARGVEILGSNLEAHAWYAPTTITGTREVAIVDAETRDDDAFAVSLVKIDLDAGKGMCIEPAPIVPVDSLFDFTGVVQQSEPPFSVEVRRTRELRAPLIPQRAPIGGSEGHIVFGLRGRAFSIGGADVDLALMLACAMRDEGFTVDLVEDAQSAVALQPDLIHAFGVADATVSAAYGRVAKSLGVPFALHTLYDAPARGGYWGASVTPYCFRFMHDEASVANLCALMRDRRVAVNQIVADGDFHPTQPRWREEMLTALALADIVFVLGSKEAADITQLDPQARIVPCPMPVSSAGEAAPIDALTGSLPFALLHAPIEATQNQLLAARAAELANIPLVIAGPIADADYAALLRAFAGDRVVVLGEPDEATLEGLYRGADLFVDVAWVSCGLARAARAVSRGAALVLSDRAAGSDLGLDDFARLVSPGDTQTIARGLGDMWTVRQHEAARFEEIRGARVAGWGVLDVTTGIVGAYGRALEKRSIAVS